MRGIHRYAPIGGLLLLTGILALGGAPLAAAAALEEILKTWEKRAEGIKSLQGECVVTRTELIDKEGPNNDLFAERRAGAVTTPVEMTKQIIFSLLGEKVASVSRAEMWDDEKKGLQVQTHYQAFDGKRNYSLHLSRFNPMGSMDDARSPSESLTNNSHYYPFWAMYSPVKLIEHRKVLPMEKLTLADREVECDGQSCYELSVLAGPNDELKFVLYVNSKHGFRPERYENHFKGVPRHTTVLKYDSRPGDSWNLNGFQILRYTKEGEPSVDAEAAVNLLRINGPIDERAFRVDYPIGAHVKVNGQARIIGQSAPATAVDDIFGESAPATALGE